MSPFYHPHDHRQHGRRPASPSRYGLQGHVHLPGHRLRRRRQRRGRRLPPHPGRLRRGDALRRRRGRHHPPGHRRLHLHAGPDHLRATPSRASIPFDAERSGFVMGEGAGILVLEELRARHGPGRQDLRGGGGLRRHLRRLPHHRPRPRRRGRRAAPWPLALADAGVAPEQVDYINAHGTSTPLNDAGETAAVKTGVWRPRRQADDQLHQVHDRPHAGGRRRGGGHLHRPEPCRTALSPPPSTTRSPTRPATWTSCPTRAGRRTSSMPCPTPWASAATTPACCCKKWEG